MELGSLKLIFPLSWPVVVTNKNGSDNTGERVSYLLQMNYIYPLYFMIMNWFVLAKTEKKKVVKCYSKFHNLKVREPQYRVMREIHEE